jgi:hypothetical protein
MDADLGRLTAKSDAGPKERISHSVEMEVSFALPAEEADCGKPSIAMVNLLAYRRTVPNFTKRVGL